MWPIRKAKRFIKKKRTFNKIVVGREEYGREGWERRERESWRKDERGDGKTRRGGMIVAQIRDRKKWET